MLNKKKTIHKIRHHTHAKIIERIVLSASMRKINIERDFVVARVLNLFHLCACLFGHFDFNGSNISTSLTRLVFRFSAFNRVVYVCELLLLFFCFKMVYNSRWGISGDISKLVGLICCCCLFGVFFLANRFNLVSCK